MGFFSPITLKRELLAYEHHLHFVHEARKQIARILDGTDPRLLLIIGPCSIHDVKAAKEYATRLKTLAEAVSSSFFIVMRTYFEKPRTTLGWKGMLYDPHLDGSYDMAAGIRLARELLLDLAEMQIPTATEFLDPAAPPFLSDLISWSCIGARTAESQIHRQFASGLPMPVAFKNNTCGNVDVAIHGVLTAAVSHTFLGINDIGQLSTMTTNGNPYAHIALRGGGQAPNYDEKSIARTLALLRKHALPERVIVDCAHDNSNRCHEQQSTVFKSVVEQYLDGNEAIRGLALESHLFGGSQPMAADKSQMQYAVSLTDPCLDWESTERLVRKYAACLDAKRCMLVSTS